ncbi:MAG: DUF4294 domain-containing protein [Bacteroidales bacterium]|nr:DUF4294 domain-containing protein [Bacteroidales bacterium]
MKRLIIILMAVFIATSIDAQDLSKATSTLLYPTIIVDGDTIPYIRIKEVVKRGRRRFRSKREMQQYYKMIRNLKKTYPYAQVAKTRLFEMNEHIKTLHTKREVDAYIKQSEKAMRAEFEKKLVKLTISQGRMLIKLIDRETGQTSYQLVRELKGGFSAGFWQGVARLFGSNLKTKFDPQGEDKVLNELIILYEQGLL